MPTLTSSLLIPDTPSQPFVELHPVKFSWKGYSVQFERVQERPEGETQYYARRADVQNLRWYRYIACVVRRCFGLEGGTRWRISRKDEPAMHRTVGQWYRIDTLPVPVLADITEQLRAVGDVRDLIHLAAATRHASVKLAGERQREEQKANLLRRAAVYSNVQVLLDILAEMATLDQPFRSHMIRTLISRLPHLPKQDRPRAWEAIVTAIERLDRYLHRNALAQSVDPPQAQWKTAGALWQCGRCPMSKEVARRLLKLSLPLFPAERWWGPGVILSAFVAGTDDEIQQVIHELGPEHRLPVLSFLANGFGRDCSELIFQELEYLPLPHQVTLISSLSRPGQPSPRLTAYADTMRQPYRLQAELLLMSKGAWSHNADIEKSLMMDYFLSHDAGIQDSAFPTFIDAVVEQGHGFNPADMDRLVEIVYQSPRCVRDQLALQLAKVVPPRLVIAEDLMKAFARRVWSPPLPEDVLISLLQIWSQEWSQEKVFDIPAAWREQLLESVHEMCVAAVPQLSKKGIVFLLSYCEGVRSAAAFIEAHRCGLPAEQQAEVLKEQTLIPGEVALYREALLAAAAALETSQARATALVALFDACIRDHLPYVDVLEQLLTGWHDEDFAAVMFPVLAEMAQAGARARHATVMPALIEAMIAAAAHHRSHIEGVLPKVIKTLCEWSPPDEQKSQAICKGLFKLIDSMVPDQRHTPLLLLVELSRRWLNPTGEPDPTSAAAYGDLLGRMANMTLQSVDTGKQSAILTTLVLAEPKPKPKRTGLVPWLLQKVLPNRTLLPSRIRRIADAVESRPAAQRWPVFAAMLMRGCATEAELHYAFAQMGNAAKTFEGGQSRESRRWKWTSMLVRPTTENLRSRPYDCLFHPEGYETYTALFGLTKDIVGSRSFNRDIRLDVARMKLEAI